MKNESHFPNHETLILTLPDMLDWALELNLVARFSVNFDSNRNKCSNKHQESETASL